MSYKEKHIEIFNSFMEGKDESERYDSDNTLHNYVLIKSPHEILNDIWKLIAYEGYTENEAIEKIEVLITESLKNRKRTPPFKLISLEIAKNFIRATEFEQWNYPKEKTSRHLQIFFDYSVETSVITLEALEEKIQEHKPDWDLVIEEILTISTILRQKQQEADSNKSKINKIISDLPFRNTRVKQHVTLCNLAIDYYNTEENKFREWASEVLADNLNHNYYNEQPFAYLVVLIEKNRDKYNYTIPKATWEYASAESKQNLLLGWEKLKKSALGIAQHHVVISDEDTLLNEAEQKQEEASKALEVVYSYIKYRMNIDSGLTNLSRPQHIRIKGKVYTCDDNLSVVKEEAEKWANEVDQEYEKLRAKKYNYEYFEPPEDKN